eukprot:2603805-Amphidinium_carterae.1
MINDIQTTARSSSLTGSSCSILGVWKNPCGGRCSQSFSRVDHYVDPTPRLSTIPRAFSSRGISW